MSMNPSKSVEEQIRTILQPIADRDINYDDVYEGRVEQEDIEAILALLSAERIAGGIEATQRLAPIMADEDKEYRLRITSEYLASLRREL